MLKRNSFLTICFIGLILRCALIFFNHPWDIQTFYNFFVDLAQNRSPYDTMQYLSTFARIHVVSGWDYNFEYYAYPPLPIILYFLPAKLFSLLHPNLNYNFVVSHAFPVLAVPWDFNFFLKIPLFLSDIGIAYLLWKNYSLKIAKSFFLNPYIIFVSAVWTFDSIMTFFLLASVVALQKKWFTVSGCLLALGFLTKIVPLFVFPALVIYLIKKEIKLKQFLGFIASFVTTSLIFILPFYQGMKFILDFHNSRVGGGLTPQLIVGQLPYYLSNNFIGFSDLLPIYHFIIPNVSSLVFIIGMLFVYYLIAKYKLSLNQTILLSLLGYLIFNKIINEQYVFIAIPFLLADKEENPGKLRQVLYQLLWAVPLGFAFVNVSILGFLFPALHTFNLSSQRLILYADWVTGSSIRLMFLRASALLFSATALFYSWYTVRKERTHEIS